MPNIVKVVVLETDITQPERSDIDNAFIVHPICVTYGIREGGRGIVIPFPTARERDEVYERDKDDDEAIEQMIIDFTSAI